MDKDSNTKVLITIWAKFLIIELAIIYIVLYIGELGRAFVEAFYEKELDPFMIRTVVISTSAFISIFIISRSLFKDKFNINLKPKIITNLILVQIAIMLFIVLYGFVSVEVNVSEVMDNRLISKYIEYIDVQTMIKEVRILWGKVGIAYLITSEISSFLVCLRLNKWLAKNDNKENRININEDVVQI